MSTAPDDLSSQEAAAAGGEKCRVVVLYEDTPDRERAVALGHHLVEQFWNELDFEFTWWRFRFFEDPEIAEAAAYAAARADVIVVSAPATKEPALLARAWLELWVPHRSDAVGVLLPLLHPAEAEILSLSPWMALLEELSHQTGMECLLPDQLRASPLFQNPALLLQHRAHHVSGVLDRILHNLGHPPAPPVHWGLNE